MKVNKFFGAAIAALSIVACSTKPALTLSGLDPQAFVGEKDGKATALYTLTNANGMEVCITNFGGRLVSVMVPDKDGNMVDVILGFDNINDYMTKASDFGASIGRYANRIAGGTFELDGQKVVLNQNDGENCLHGGAEGWQYQVYEAEQTDPQTLKLTMVDPDGHMGFPGTVTAVVTYKLTDDNAIDITYSGTTDKPTVLSMTNHAYFSLSGKHAEEGTDMVLYVNADTFTPANDKLIPTGEMRPVEGTPFDFREPHAIGERIDVEHEQLINGKGYDLNWVIAREDNGQVETVATLYDPTTGRCMDVATDQVALQFYSGNFFDGTTNGKYGKSLNFRESVALETQKHPDAINHDGFPSIVLNPDEVYTHVCIYKFYTK